MRKDTDKINAENRHANQDFTFVELLQFCAKKKDVCRGTRIHLEVLRKGLLEKSPYIATTLIHMYVKCGLFPKAKQVFEELSTRDVAPWTSLIGGYVQDGQSHEAIDCFYRMQSEGLYPNEVTFICILKACGSVRSMDNGKRVHDAIVSRGLLEKNAMLGNALVHMYAKCGDFVHAYQVLRHLPSRDEVSWSILIVGYVQAGLCHEALHCLAHMQRDGFFPNVVTFVYLLKACGRIGAIEEGRRIHNEITTRRLLDKNIVLGNALLDMYVKCGMLAKAHRVLDELPNRDVISWNTLTAGYVRHEQGHKALDCVTRMQKEGLPPNEITYSCILKACGSIRAIDKGEEIHDEIANKCLLEKNVMLGTALVSMYAKCGVLVKAQQVLEKICIRNVVSWNALISGYVQHAQPDEALNSFQRMQTEGVSPDIVTLACILKACGSVGNIDRGNEIHDEIVNRGLLRKNIMLGNALVDMYTKCGVLTKARQVFEGLPARDVVSWSSLIAGYARNGHGHEAYKCFKHMQKEGFTPNEVTFTCVLKACGSMGAIEKGEQIHDEIVSKNFLEKNMVLGNALVDMYAKCGALIKAQQVHEKLCIRNVVSWNALIVGYAQQGAGHEALNCVAMMQNEGITLDEVTFTSILMACGSIGAIEKGKQIHHLVASQDLVKKNVVLGTALVNMYAKCDMLVKAQQVLNELCVRNVVAWNTLLAGYIQQEKSHEVFKCFSQMKKDGLSPDEVTFMFILKACGNLRALDKGSQIHDEILSLRLLSTTNDMLGNALVEMYAKCGAFPKAQKVLEEISVCNVASWNALMQGYIEHEQFYEALDCFIWMKRNRISPNETTFVCVLKACSTIGAFEKGKKIHDELIHTGFLKESVVLGNMLVDMYAKCGVLEKAREVLLKIPIRSIISWNALIAGYAQEGQCHDVLVTLGHMQKDGISPNEVTILHVLKACSQLGKLREAEMYYENMSKDYHITPILEHHTCMVGALGYGGCFEKAMFVINKISHVESPCIWIALLGACRKWGNVKLGRLAFDRAIELDPNLASPYALMSSIYGDSGMCEDVQKIEIMRHRNRVYG